MGKKTRRFISKHPWCCFCGGDTPSTTRDHQPARAFFSDRLVPEDFIFPACEDCNHGTSQDEELVAGLIAMQDITLSTKEASKAVDRISNHKHRLRFIAEPQKYTNIHGVLMPSVLATVHFEKDNVPFMRVYEKIFKAIHNRETSISLPSDYKIKLSPCSAEDYYGGTVPKEHRRKLFKSKPFKHSSMRKVFDYQSAIYGPFIFIDFMLKPQIVTGMAWEGSLHDNIKLIAEEELLLPLGNTERLTMFLTATN